MAYYGAVEPQAFDAWLDGQTDGERVIIQDGEPVRYTRRGGNVSVERFARQQI